MLLSSIPWDLYLFTVPVVWVINRLDIYAKNHFGNVTLYGHFTWLNILANILSCSKCLGLWLGLSISIGYFFGNIQENFWVIVAFSAWNSVFSYIFTLLVYCFERLAGQ